MKNIPRNKGYSRVAVNALRAGAYRIPIDAPEPAATFCWDATTLGVIRIETGGACEIEPRLSNVGVNRRFNSIDP